MKRLTDQERGDLLRGLRMIFRGGDSPRGQVVWMTGGASYFLSDYHTAVTIYRSDGEEVTVRLPDGPLNFLRSHRLEAA